MVKIIALLSLFSFVAMAEDLEEVTLNGFTMAGSEYWPYKPDGSFKYPDDIKWGFIPPDVNQDAIACARKSIQAFKAFMATPPADLARLKDLGATTEFFLWTNDYTAVTSDSVTPRSARVWHWTRNTSTDPKVKYSKGYWKWEATLTRDKVCEIPKTEQILEKLKEVREEMGASRGFVDLKRRFRKAQTDQDKEALRDEMKLLFKTTSSKTEKARVRDFLKNNSQNVPATTPPKSDAATGPTAR